MYHKSEITTYGTFSCTFKFPTYGTFLYGCTHILSDDDLLLCNIFYCVAPLKQS